MIIERLIARGVAYVAEDHVLFSVARWSAARRCRDTARSRSRSLDEMLAGARVDVAPYKRDPMDFVLWKPSGPQRAGLAVARRHRDAGPSGLAHRVLGDGVEASGQGLRDGSPATIRRREVFDIHGGGIDLVFPTTRTRSPSPAARSARRAWRMSGCTTASCRSKARRCRRALGNFITIHDLLREIGPARCCASPCCARITASRSTGRCAGSRRARRRCDRWYGLCGAAAATGVRRERARSAGGRSQHAEDDRRAACRSTAAARMTSSVANLRALGFLSESC